VGGDLLVCDLDGTLIDESVTLAPALVDAFRRAAARGLAISLATGRMPAAADTYRAALDIQAPLICGNGALVRDPASGRDLVAHLLPRGLLASLADVLASAPVHPLFFRDDQVYCLALTPAVRHYGAEEGLRARVIPDPGEFLRLGAFVKALFIGHPDALPVLREALAPVVGARARLLRTRRDYLELVPAAASKGAALSWLAAHLGVRLERVVAVGDQENDLEMIQTAGLGIAMPHAPAAVRAVADRIAPAPEAGGLLALLGEVLPGYFDPGRAAGAAP
jgi:Cof subfamily protein (haloacid dehalogenase superfamily)